MRFISNRSTGYIGYKIAEVASKRNYVVTLISGPTRLQPPNVKKFITIDTPDELFKAVKRELKNADCLIMCAAVADFKPRCVSNKKLKRQKRLSITLVPNKDLLLGLARYKRDKLFVGFSLETDNLIENSLKKLKNKNLDLIVANKLTKQHNPFGNKRLDVVIIDKSGHIDKIKNKDKDFIARLLLDKVEKMCYTD